MRTIPSAALSLLDGKLAIESIIIVEIQWGDGASTTRLYADKDLDDVEGRIVSLSAFDDVVKVDGEGASGSVSITLSDIDGQLQTIFNNSDIHKRSAKLYQYFAGLELDTKFLILDGQISTPMEWDEGKRTLKFDIVTKVENYEIGFSADEGNFPSIPYDLIGVPWPMLFGYVLHYPALQITQVPSAFTAEAFGVMDPTLGAQIGLIQTHVQQLRDAAVGALNAAVAACWNEVWEGSLNGQNIFDTNCNDSPDVKRFNDQAVQLQEQANQEDASLDDLQAQQAKQGLWVRSSVKLIAQGQVTQAFAGTMRIGNNLFHGTLTTTGFGRLSCQPIVTQPVALNDDPGQIVQQVIQPQGFQFFNAGTQVQFAAAYPITFIVSIVPGTVIQVWSYRSINGLKQLVPVPSSYYNVTTLSYGAVEAVAVVLNQPLSSINFTQNLAIQNWENGFGQFLPSHIVPQIDWEDQIYVTFQSSVGPNTVDIIEYLLERYAVGLTVDATSFDATRTYLTNYPMNFGVASRENVLAICAELAYQARCALYIRNSVVYLKYLPVEEDAVDTVTEDEIEVDSLIVSCTPTESLVTKYIATFRPDYTPTYQQPVEAIFRANVNKYGVQEESHDYYAYRDFYEVQKSATFWMIRKSNTWKLLQCKLLLSKLNLETFDTVTLDFAHPHVASGPVKAIVNSASYNSADNTIDAEFWIPVRLGEMSTYDFAWPAGIVESDFYPHHSDVTAGAAGGINGGVQGTLPPANGLRIDVAPIPEGKQTSLNTGFYQNDGLDGLLGFDPPPVPEPLPIEAPIDTKYTYPRLTDPAIVPVATGSATYPCTIDAFVGFDDTGRQKYEITAYPSGTINEGKKIKLVKQLQLDRDDRIPEGAETHVIINSWLEGANVKREATVQVPVWQR